MTKSYTNGIPSAVNSPGESIFHVVEVPNYRRLRPDEVEIQLSAKSVMDVLSQGKVLVIRHDTNEQFKMFSAALEAMTQKDQRLDLHGKHTHKFKDFYIKV